LQQNACRHVRPDAIHCRHAQSQDHGNGFRHVRRHHAGAGRLEIGLGEVGRSRRRNRTKSRHRRLRNSVFSWVFLRTVASRTAKTKARIYRRDAEGAEKTEAKTTKPLKISTAVPKFALSSRLTSFFAALEYPPPSNRGHRLRGFSTNEHRHCANEFSRAEPSRQRQGARYLRAWRPAADRGHRPSVRLRRRSAHADSGQGPRPDAAFAFLVR